MELLLPAGNGAAELVIMGGSETLEMLDEPGRVL